jgi:hypothetical protein
MNDIEPPHSPRTRGEGIAPVLRERVSMGKVNVQSVIYFYEPQ